LQNEMIGPDNSLTGASSVGWPYFVQMV